jgi:two-component system, chemotaxis family, CheB/CheR fusion protein
MKFRGPKPVSHVRSEPRERSDALNMPFPIVAVGASAGGLEAYTEFFHALPDNTGMGFVLVQHLDPTHDSLLAEIIKKATKMPVAEVKSGIKIRPNCIYVIPPKSLMTLAGSVLRLTPRNLGARSKGSRERWDLAVNHFMRSLALERKSGAIGIVLSGTGGDGSAGLEDIKAHGGITFAQEPASAKFDGMPRSAIDSGCVDFILPPGEIAKTLIEIRRHPYVALNEEPSETTDSDISPSLQKAFARVLEQLRRVGGVDFSQYKSNTIHRRALRRMMVLKIESLDEYAKHLRFLRTKPFGSRTKAWR